MFQEHRSEPARTGDELSVAAASTGSDGPDQPVARLLNAGAEFARCRLFAL